MSCCVKIILGGRWIISISIIQKYLYAILFPFVYHFATLTFKQSIVISFKGCASFIGRQGGAQLVAVEAEKCTGSGLGTIMHLIFHALGRLWSLVNNR